MSSMTNFVAEKFGDFVKDKVTDAIKGALGGDKDEGEDEDGGGLFSFGRDKKKGEDEDGGGLFSFGRDKKKGEDEDDKEGFFSRFLNKDDDDDRKQKKSGFSGLFSEQGGDGGSPGQAAPACDGELLDDLYSVAQDTSKAE